jgi:penicillin-binding protein 1A
MEDGFKQDDTIEDTPITTGRYRPEDYGRKYEGIITLRHAFAESSNVAAVRLIERIGPKRVIAVARRLGITSPLSADASLALGTSETTLLEMTGAYAAFANGGDDVFPYGFADVTDGPGHAVYQRDGGGTGRVIEHAALAKMTDLLVAVVQGGTGKAAALDRPVGGKTGTTQDYKDAWFIGFTADYVAGVWLGNDDGTPLNKITGGSLPTKLWHNVMVAAHQGLPVRELPGQVPEAESDEAAAAGESKAPESSDESSESVWQSLVHMLTGGSHP